MPNTVNSANMSLPVPVVGVDPGPDYANNINSCFSIIDAHNHTAGLGVPVPSSGLNINADLTFGANNATHMKSVRFEVQGSPLAGGSDLGCIYVSGVDLYYNDENGNQIQITSSGAVAGTPGSISGLVPPASASYSSGPGTFIFESAASTAGNIDGGSLTIREQIPSAKGVKLASPASLGANYTLTFMAGLPVSTKFLSIDSSGNIASSWAVDNSTIEISSNTVQVKALGITSTQLAANAVTTAKIADQNVTQAKMAVMTTGTTVAAGGLAVSTGSGAFTTASATPVDVTSVTVTITTTGRPVMIFLENDPTVASGSNVGEIQGGTAGPAGSFSMFAYIKQGSTIIFITELEGTTTPATAGCSWSPGSIMCIDFPAAGTYTYKLQVVLNTGTQIVVRNVSLVAYEI